MASGQYGEGGKPPDGNLERDLEYQGEIDAVYDVDMRDSGEERRIVNSKLEVLRKISNRYSIDKNTEQKEASYQLPSQNSQQVKLIENNFELKYSQLYDGPCYVYMEHLDKNVGRLHEMSLGRILHEKLGLKKCIKEINRLGKNRVRVELKSLIDVHNLIKNPQLKQEGLHAFVPKYLTERRGVVKGVDISLPEEYLVKNIECDGVVKEVKRMLRKITLDDGTTNLVPTSTITINFVGTVLPPFIAINSVRRIVNPYVYNVVRCFRCFRFGHVSAQCRSAEQKCKYCGEVQHEGNCQQNSKKCIHCGSLTHDALSKDCPNFKKEKLVKEKMAESNCTYTQAKKLIEDPFSFSNTIKNNSNSSPISSNRFSALANVNDLSDFPPMSPVFNYKPRVNAFKRVPERLTVVQPSNNATSFKKRKPSSPPLGVSPIDPRIFPLKPLPDNSNAVINTEEEIKLLISNLTEYLNTIIKGTDSIKAIDPVTFRDDITTLIKNKKMPARLSNK